MTSRSRRRPTPPRVQLRSIWACGLSLAAAIAAAGSVSAAEFTLASGDTVSGVIARIGGGYVSIRTKSGVQLTPTEAIRRVAVTDDAGRRVEGELAAWRDGVYEIASDDGRVEVSDRDVAEFDDLETDPRMVSPQNVEREVGEVRIFAQSPTTLALRDEARRNAAQETGPISAETEDPAAPTPPPATTPSPLQPADGIAARPTVKPTSKSRVAEAPRESAAIAAKPTAAPRASIGLSDSAPDLSALPKPRAPAADQATAASSAPPSLSPLAAAEIAAPPSSEPEAKPARAKAAEAPRPAARRAPPPPSRSRAQAPFGASPQVSAAPPLPRGAFAQLGPSNSGELRSVLKEIIHGDGEAAAPSAATPKETAPKETARGEEPAPAPRLAATAGQSAPKGEIGSRPKAGAAKADATKSDATGSVAARPDIRSTPAAARATKAPASIADAAAPTPPRPGGDPAARALAERVSGQSGVAACWSLAVARAPLAAAATGRPDPTALVIAASEEIPAALLERALAADFALIGAESAVASTDAGLEVSQVPGPLGARLSRPERYQVLRVANADAASNALKQRRADLAWTLTPVAKAPDGAAFALLPLVAVTAQSGPVKALTRAQLRGLLSGAISDWSMLEPTRRGPPRLYLPPVGSASLRALLAYVGLRRADPAAAAYIADPAERVAAALKGGDGVAFALGEAAAKDGARVSVDAAAQITPKALRSGDYPLTLALVAAEGAGPDHHPLAGDAQRRLAAPESAAAILEQNGFAAAALCASQTCAPDIARIAQRLEDRAGAPLKVKLDTIENGSEVLARLALPKTPSAADAETALNAFLNRRAARPNWIPRALTLRVARAPGAAARAEAIGLALRCAGAPVAEALVDAKSTLPEDAVEILAR